MNLDSCHPEDGKKIVCATCRRYRPGRPLHTDIRQYPVIDATAIRWPDGKCPMYAEREIVRPYTELEKESA